MSDEESPFCKRKKSPSIAATLKPKSNVISVRPTVRASPKIAVPKEATSSASKHGANPEKRMKRADDGASMKEIDKFKMLFPGHEDEKKPATSKEKATGKKTPFKSKVKKVIPRSKKSAALETMDFSWFDSDAAFGFGTEE